MDLNPGGPIAHILDRRTETATLLQALEDRRDVLLYGPRRLGKTSLLLHIIDRLHSKRMVIHVDCTRKETDEEIASALLQQLSGFAGRSARFWDWIKEHLEGTRTRIVQDGSKTRIELDLSERSGRSIPDAVELIGQVAEKAGRPALIVLDEWQYVMLRNDESLLWQLRSVSQSLPDLQLVFSGSEASILSRMVDAKDKAYWKGLIRMPLQGIGIDDVLDDLPSLGIAPDAEAVDLIREACGTTTLRLVEVLHRLSGAGPVTKDVVMDALRAVIHMHAADFEDRLAEVKPGPQRRILFGLARDRPEYVTGHEFLQAHGIKTPATATQALQRLRRIEVIDDENAFIDALFRWYLVNED